jgi:LacI family gluconate utilization system Gnt-I transcriptional repressor
MTKVKARRHGGSAVRMSDIARHAGVSPMTVSRALSEPGTV